MRKKLCASTKFTPSLFVSSFNYYVNYGRIFKANVLEEPYNYYSRFIFKKDRNSIKNN